MRLHSALGATQHEGNLSDRQIIDVPEHDRIALRRRRVADTSPERIVDQRRILRRHRASAKAANRYPLATMTSTLVRGTVQRHTPHPPAWLSNTATSAQRC